MKFRLLLCTLVFSLLCGCSSADINIGRKYETGAHYTKSFNVTGPVQLSINGQYVNVELYTWEKDEVKLEVTCRLRGALEKEELDSRIKDFYINTKESNGIISFISGYKGNNKGIDEEIVDLRVFTAKNIASINMEIGNGSIRLLDDLNCRLSAVLDKVNTEINRLEGSINLKVNMGNVRLCGGKLMGESNIVTTMGNIDVKTAFDEQGSYRFETKVGNIDLMVPEKSRVSFYCKGTVETNQFNSTSNSTMYPCRVTVVSEIGEISIKKFKEF